MLGNRRSTSDIISNLPSSIVENILKYLPLRDAGRTSVLSRRWRYKWVTLPQLVFNNEFFLSLGDTEKIKAVIYRVLLLHQGPLTKFVLEYPPLKSCLDIDNWILMLLKKNIQDFTLCLSDRQQASCHELPCYVFSFLQLKHLVLISCVFKPLPIFKGFSRLVDLKLFGVILAPEMLGQFISNCPLLERLRLFYCTQFDFLVINAPNLKDFIFSGTLKSVSFKNTPLLARVSIELLSSDANVRWPVEEAVSEWVRFFQRLPAAIEEIHLDSAFLESFAAGHIPERIPSTSNHLKVLALSYISTYVLDHVSHALCLLRSFPNLERFEILICNIVRNGDPVAEYLQAQDFSKSSLNQLRKVKMWNFSGAESEMQFAKILLAHSDILETMVILQDPDIFDEVGVAMLEEFTRFPKASPKAEVVYMPWDDESSIALRYYGCERSCNVI